MRNVRIIRYGGWVEFTRDLFTELFGDGIFRQGRYLFRGASNADWGLSSYFDRRFATVPLERRLAAFR